MLNAISHQGMKSKITVRNHFRLPATQGTQVRSLIWEDATCRGATKSLHHNDGAHTPESMLENKPTMRSLCHAKESSPQTHRQQ